MSRQFVDLWGWFDRFYAQANLVHDEERIRLCRFKNTAFNQRERNPEHALALFSEAATLAHHLNEHWMTLFYQYWIAEMLIFYLGRTKDGLAYTSQLVTKASHAYYINCPVRARIFITLIAVYQDLDALGYQDEILAMVETMLSEIPLDEDTYQRLYYYRAEAYRQQKQYDEALAYALRYAEASSNDAYRLAHAYHLLCHIAYLRNDDQQALTYTHLMREKALASDQITWLAASYSWEAILVWVKGDHEAGERLHLRGVAEHNRMGIPKGVSYSLARYYDVTGQYEKALALWDEDAARMRPEFADRPGHFSTLLRRCFVLRRMGCLTEADIAQTRQAAMGLRKPERYLVLMDALNDGRIEIPRY